MADASAYYLVGYTPTRRTNDGKFHEIKVRVKRRGVRVTARRGYWAASEKEMTAAAEAAATPVNVALTTALSSLSDSVNTRAVSIWTGFAKADARAHARHVHVGAELPAHRPTSRRGSRSSRSTRPARRRCRRR